MARKYGRKASKKVERSMHEMKRGRLRSGRSGRKVTNPKQAIAIGLSEARREGDKVPSRGRRKTQGRRRAAGSRSRSAGGRRRAPSSRRRSSASKRRSSAGRRRSSSRSRSR